MLLFYFILFRPVPMWSHRCSEMAPASDVWKYVTRRDDKTVVCNICRKELVVSGSNTILRLHLERNHRVHFTEEAGHNKLQGEPRTERIPGILSTKDRAPKIMQLIGIDNPATVTTHSSSRISEMLRECAAQLETEQHQEIHSFAGGGEPCTALAEDELSMVLQSYHLARDGSVGSRRRKETELNYARASQVSCQEKSQTWDFFKKLNERCVECSLCRKQLCYHNSATSLREHLRRKHNLSELDLRQSQDEGSSSSESMGQELEVKKNKPVSISELVLHDAKACSEKREEVISNLILGMVFRDLQPISFVNNEGFKRLLGFLQPGYKIPSSVHLTASLRHKYAVAKLQLEHYLHSVPSLTLSTDTWTSQGKQTYLTVVGHFIDCRWRLARCVLKTTPQYNPAPDYIGELLYSVISEFGVSCKAVNCVVHDSAGNLMSSSRLLQERFGWSSLCCAGRMLQLCIKLGLQVEQVQHTLSVARRIVNHFVHSARANAELSTKLAEMNKERLVLVIDTATRWSSTFDMCERLLELRWAVSMVLEEDRTGHMTVENLSDHQWKLLQDLLPVLKTLKVASSFLSEEHNASVSSLVPCLHGVMTALMQHHGDPGCIVKAVSAKIRTEIAKRWRLPDDDEMMESPAIVASFLDPRFKDLRFLSADMRDKVHNKVKNMLSSAVASPRSRSSSSSSDEHSITDHEQGSKQRSRKGGRRPSQCEYDLLFGEDPIERMPEIHQQLESYLAEPLRKRNTNPFDWWKNNEHRFPAVANLAKQYLAIPATSVSATRAFFCSSSIPDQTRSALLPDNIDQILFLHKNFDYIESLKRYRQ
ncbi:E3 SUMO-protein ligase ZBED1-like [Rhincodon typus]|uniref:E3 SUMO-protein ligase ZBED1-like n=1 Tax=Rhincodon typus TaxID=259920 RepID=UPI00203052FD|nr:E3 SUMO-protein ligase ZBED1-like [Rhincodon typus]